MRISRASLLAGVVLLVACQTTPIVGRPKASTRPSETAVSPQGPAPVTPATAVSNAGFKLQKPASKAVSTLSGRIQLDASYMVSSGSGQFLSHNGAAIVAAGGGNIVAAGGGNVLVGNQIVAAGGGNIIAQGGGNFVGHNGSAIIAQGGGNFISHNGSAAVVKGGNYKLQQDTVAPPHVKAGTQVPAVGMRIQVYSLRSSQLLPLGVGPDGNPVYAVYSNADGAYEIYIPAEEQGNVLIEASDPAKNDSRTTYDVVTAPQSTGALVVDEDSAAMTHYIIQAFTGRLEDLLTRPIDRTLELLRHWGVPDAEACLTSTALAGIHAIGVKHGLVGVADSPARHALIYTGMLAAMSTLKLQEIPSVPRSTDPNNERALAMVARIMRKYRLRAIDLIATDPAFFDKTNFVKEANVCDPNRYKIKQPSDVVDLFVREYFGVSDSDSFGRLGRAMGEFHAENTPFTENGPDQDALETLSTSFLFTLVTELNDPTSAASLAIEAVLAGPAPSLDPNASPVPTPCWAALSPVPSGGSPGPSPSPGKDPCLTSPKP